MRQFILAKNVAYSTATSLAGMANGSVQFTKITDGTHTPFANGDKDDKVNLIMKREDAAGGPIVIPIHKNNFSYVKGTYQAATTFVESVTIPAPTTKGTYAIIVAKKGVKFNERNKWTVDVYVDNTSITAAALATKLADAVNKNNGHGVKATVSSATITFTATEAGVDYVILGAELLTGITVTHTTSGTPAYGDAKYVADLADKAAADAGFEYTYLDANAYMYPNYPLDPLKGTQATDTGFTIFTLRFAEPRDVKTRDEVVNQIVQVAFPTGATAITEFENKLKTLAGTYVAVVNSDK